MIIRTYTYPFRTATLHFHDKIKESSYEKALVKRYLDFLKMLEKKDKKVQAVREDCYKEQLLVDEVNQERMEIEQQLAVPQARIKKMMAAKKLVDAEFKQMRKEYDVIADNFNLLSDKLPAINKLIGKNNKHIDGLLEWFEDQQYTDFMMLHRFSNAMYKVKANFALDSVRFYDEINEMKTDWQKVSRGWDELFKLREKIGEETDNCIAKMSELNSAMKQFEADVVGITEGWQALNN